MAAVAVALFPSPEIVIVGAVKYPLPGLVIVILVIDPASITAVPVAVIPFPEGAEKVIVADEYPLPLFVIVIELTLPTSTILLLEPSNVNSAGAIPVGDVKTNVELAPLSSVKNLSFSLSGSGILNLAIPSKTISSNTLFS